MKKLLLMTTAFVLTASTAYAVDDSFGNRFGNSAPNALEDTKEISIDDISDLVNIAPAAGDESALVDSSNVTIDAEAGSEDAQAQAQAIAAQPASGIGVDVKIETPAPTNEIVETKTEAEALPEAEKTEAPVADGIPAAPDDQVETAVETEGEASPTEPKQDEPAATTDTETISE